MKLVVEQCAKLPGRLQVKRVATVSCPSVGRRADELPVHLCCPGTASTDALGMLGPKPCLDEHGVAFTKCVGELVGALDPDRIRGGDQSVVLDSGQQEALQHLDRGETQPTVVHGLEDLVGIPCLCGGDLDKDDTVKQPLDEVWDGCRGQVKQVIDVVSPSDQIGLRGRQLLGLVVPTVEQCLHARTPVGDIEGEGPLAIALAHQRLQQARPQGVIRRSTAQREHEQGERGHALLAVDEVTNAIAFGGDDRPEEVLPVPSSLTPLVTRVPLTHEPRRQVAHEGFDVLPLPGVLALVVLQAVPSAAGQEVTDGVCMAGDRAAVDYHLCTSITSPVRCRPRLRRRGRCVRGRSARRR